MGAAQIISAIQTPLPRLDPDGPLRPIGAHEHPSPRQPNTGIPPVPLWILTIPRRCVGVRTPCIAKTAGRKPKMTRMKIVDVPDTETNVEQIQARLEAFLHNFRRTKLARDLISDDERSGEFQIDDFDTFADDLYRGVKLSVIDKRRIKHRAAVLAKRRKTLAGLDHLKPEEQERLAPILRAGVSMVVISEARADEVAAAIHDEMPWMASATEEAWLAMRRSAQRGEPVRLTPMIVNGPPGIGKSVWARRLAELLRIPSCDIDGSKGGVGFALVGTERGWSTAQPGRPLETILSRRIGNPLVIVDEICKAKVGTSASGAHHSFADSLLSMVEPATARSWECVFFRLRFDVSHISWVMTANTIDQVPEPLRTRCRVIHVPKVSQAQLIQFAERQAVKLCLRCS